MLGRLLRFSSKDVFTNLASEELIFQRTAGHALLFYVNSTCVVLGRTQNPFNEADVGYAASHSFPLARRRSGGGTVVHDEGNLNFCFIRPREEHDPLYNAKFVATVLREDFGIEASVNHRADILIDGKKVSGAAYRISKNRAYHHGTLLVNSNLDQLRRLLKSPLRAGIKAMGAKSVPSPVTRLTDHYHEELNLEDVTQAIAKRYSDKSCQLRTVCSEEVEAMCGGMGKERGELCSHDWVYGQTPRFSSVHDIGNVRIQFEMRKGAIVDNITLLQRGCPSSVSKDDMPSIDLVSKDIPFDGQAVEKAFTLDNSNDSVENLAIALREEIPSQYVNEELRKSIHASISGSPVFGSEIY